MAINFPDSPNNGDTFTQGTTTWTYNGVGWAITDSSVSANTYKTITGDSGASIADLPNDSFKIEGGTSIGTTVTNDKVVISFTGSAGGAGDTFKTVTSDDGSAVASGATDTLGVLGGTNISTQIATSTKNVTVNMDSFSIDFLADVDTTSSPPTSGQVLKWNGAQWAPGVDATTGGAGTDADTLDGFDSSYFLNYNNLNNKPTILSLTALSVGIELSASGNGAISYDNTTGVFRYTPPTAAGIGALTSEVNDLTSAVTWANVPNANITQSSVVQHQTALSITESQITDLQSYLTSVSASNLSAISVDALSDVNTTTATPSDGQVLMWDSGNGYWKPSTVSGGGGGEANQNAFSTIAVPAQSNIEAESTTDTLNIVGGTGISVTTNAGTDTLTITNTSSSGATAFTGLTDVSSAGLNVALIYKPAIAMLKVDNVSASSYTFNSHYSGNNPTIYVIEGTTIAFDLSAISGHPFQIQEVGGTPYNTGLTHVTTTGSVTLNASAQGKSSGVLYFDVPIGAPDLEYVCQSHGGMKGDIVTKAISAI